MHYHVLTLFPEMIEQAMSHSITGRAQKNEQIVLETTNIRDFSQNKFMKVDDYPYGGGAGMVMEAEPVYLSYEKVVKEVMAAGRKKPKVLFMSPQGKTFHQEMAIELAKEEDLVFLCGHYEGIDERVLEEIVDEQISIGDYVLTGGEIAAVVMMDAISRLVPGVLHNDVSAITDTFTDNLLEYPQYTRPVEWRGKRVPDVLMSGHHANIEKWRREQSLLRTKNQRPDLFEKVEFTKDDMKIMKKNLAFQDEI
ncbi:MAG: tRNA (guanosine(37)-N1)-methyltransferase TrmD [Lachnospiraceae bacterium]|jgi:tRNA (guanine37-N1)-methyltransferase|nr:tRNA (guanosine(37)-N1)-methyltransferase TrmD [Lachnospiraceae bacterium]